tara:strand:- start:508 stop:900 length:393 start_codon:yes stop_codon:yes gene_type:complete
METKEKAMKFDGDKPRMDLVDKEIILELAKILTFGAEKYEAHNWKIGLPMSRYYSACMRHLLAWNSGETLDPESGLNHLSHASCNLMFMLYFTKNKPRLDDRHIPDKKELHEFIKELLPQKIPFPEVEDL